jgi:uncharacterized protein YndB with AHSA1/START domain
MSTLTIILIVVGALILLPFILAIFTSKETYIEREITINKPVTEVFGYVKYLRNSEKYNKWVMTDPHMKKEYIGTDGTVGFVYKWDSENKQVGQGEQEIVGMKENEKIDYELRFIRPFPNTANGHMTTEPAGNGTRVKYIFRGPSAYMMRVMQLVLNIKKMLARDMDTTLANLKNIMEK